MESEIIETVLKEMLEEQKVTNELFQKQNEKIEELSKRVGFFEQKQEQQKIIAPPADTVPIQNIVSQGLLKIARIVEGQPKNVIRQVRLLLFPESNTDRYYRLVFGRLIPCVIFISAVICLIPLGKQYITTRSELLQRRYYFEVYRDAWESLDSTFSKSERLKMKQALQKSVNDHQRDN